MPESPYTYGASVKNRKPDPDHRHLAEAIREVFELLKPKPDEVANFAAKLAGELNGVG